MSDSLRNHSYHQNPALLRNIRYGSGFLIDYPNLQKVSLLPSGSLT